MTIKEIPCFQFTTIIDESVPGLKDGITTVERLDFIPVDNCPGFSHRVAYNGRLTPKYLGSDFRLNQRTALDMLDIVRTFLKGLTFYKMDTSGRYEIVAYLS
jgi:hypothetical protein